MSGILSQLSKPIQRIVAEKGFKVFTEIQRDAIPLILGGKNVLVIAPTGTGKTEAAFLPILDRLVREGGRGGIKVLYISPLRALNRDLLERLTWWCNKLDLKVSVRHGDTEVKERGRQALAPPDILITTPETLQAILPGRTMKRHLAKVRWVVVDEVHELTNDKRGSQLAFALERLRRITESEPQIIGLSATIGSPGEVAKFLVGVHRECEIVRVSVAKSMDIDVELPEAGQKDTMLAERIATYPEVAARLRRIRELIDGHRSTLIFTNTRSEAEVLASRFRVWDIDIPVGIHHGSLAKSSRVGVETDLKKGELRGVVSTSSLELGIDIGSIDLVVQYNSPRQVTRLLQRIGRAGHWVGGTSKGKVITIDSDDALESVVIVKRGLKEELEEVEIVERPTDVLIHQIAGLLLDEERWTVDDIMEISRRTYPFADLKEEEVVEVLEYMSTRRPRLALYIPENDLVLRPRPSEGLYQYYFENLSMIPEEKHFIVVDEEKDEPIGTLDEAFVAEYGEPGVKFIVRGSPWKIIHIFKDSVYVRAESDPTGAIPDWVGDEIPVPFEIAQEVGAIRGMGAEILAGGKTVEEAAEEIRKEYRVSPEILTRSLREVREQVEGGFPVPTDRTVTVEEWEGYVIISCAFGLQINKTLSRLLGYMLAQRTGSGVGASQDAYRIFLKTEVSPHVIAEILKGMDAGEVGRMVEAAVERTGLFKRRLLHVAKRAGVVEKKADFEDVGLNQLAEGLKGSVIYREGMKEVFFKDLDLEGTARVVKDMGEGKYRVVVTDPDKPLSPISMIGMRELSWKTDLVPADRMRRLLIESGKARLLNESRVAVCTNCFGYVENTRVKKFMGEVRCPVCGSERIGLLTDDPAEVEQMAAEKAATGKVAEKFRRMYKSAVESGELVGRYGGMAALVLAARGLPRPVAITLITSEIRDLDYLVDLILKEERSALKSRMRRAPPGT